MSIPEPSQESAALVTGASSGIGADIARSLARRGRGKIRILWFNPATGAGMVSRAMHVR